MRKRLLIVAAAAGLSFMVADWAAACSVYANVQSVRKSGDSRYEVVFVLDVDCQRNSGCGGTIDYEVVLSAPRWDDKVVKGSSSWRINQHAGTAMVRVTGQCLPDEQPTTAVVTNTTCR